ncbi:hypothetical protein D3C74_301200 [compost metagenome]
MRMLTSAFRSSVPPSKAMMASATELNARPAPLASFLSFVRWYRPMIMSCEGMVTGRPSDGFRMLLLESMRMRASAWASADSGRCTAIWSPSKSALNAAHTSGCRWMALPSTSWGSNAWIPRRCSVGARLSSTGCSVMTSSRTSHTTGRARSTMRLALLMFCAWFRSTRRFITKGLKSSRAICFGRPHWCSLSCGPTTMTERPE